jgi:4-amino-4-deoxy-L-arabinose transferase-like glycosyltransferase
MDSRVQAPSPAVKARLKNPSPPILWGAVTLMLCALFLGYDIASRPIVLWDESRVVSNALEMRRTGFSLITTYNFQPDLWNTKPPLLIWLIAGCVRLFGPDEWVVRAPSLITAVATLVLVMTFSWRLSRNRFVTLCAPVLLALSSGFFGAHAAQSADYEMLLCLFTTAYLLLLFETIHRRRPGPGRVLLCALLVAGACLTKGVAGVMPGVGVAIYIVARGRWPRLFKTPWYALGAALAITLVGGFYLLREQASPGYWAGVMAFELGGRFLHGMKNHVQPPIYYLQTVFALFAFGPALLALFAAPFLRLPKTRSSAFLTYGAFVSVAILVVFSLSQTKLFWYMVPIYPVLSIMLAIVLERFLRLLSRNRLIASPRPIIAVAAAGLVAFGIWTKQAVLRPSEDLPQGRYGEVFAQLDKAGLRHVRAIDAGVANDDNLVNYTPQLHFYALAWRGRGMVIRLGDQGRLASIGPDEIVVTCDPRYLDAVANLGPSRTTVPGCEAARRAPN